MIFRTIMVSKSFRLSKSIISSESLKSSKIIKNSFPESPLASVYMYISEFPEIRAFHPTKSSMLAIFPIANRLHFTIGDIRGRCFRELPIRARHSPQSHYHGQLDGSVSSPLVLKH